MITTNDIHLNETLGAIVSRFPGSIPILTKHEIDFCCGGHRTLATALDLSSDQRTHPVLTELNAGYERALTEGEDFQQFRYESPTMLMDYIVHWHHERLRENLPTIEKLLAKIVAVHGSNHPELLAVEQAFTPLKAAMIEHLSEEETHSFPLIKEASETVTLTRETMTALDSLREDHDTVGDHLKAIRRLTQGFTIPEDGCSTYHFVYQKLLELETDTFQHVHLENNVLFHMIG
ncbi:iron-sulfur cluster repair di-iron protein [Anoxynatronum buryatiense]|uniref:Regulator of cell morphogenesis and NO signaling n=1 Tax=Anoxynatronum buryatiense TaxID=489973 RepID=A0AA46AJI4_9CLOT|nr:iron-sulfur cluster repair di-iron protein [Anoxynatronum buryatiense]SMP62707.1 regulator of cell morphogenesis and NO signaling [Anoxynatronum buryatiense]